MADSNRTREEGLVFLLYNYVLSRGIVLVLNCKCALCDNYILSFSFINNHLTDGSVPALAELIMTAKFFKEVL